MTEHIIISRRDAIEHLLISELEDLDCNGGYDESDEDRIQAELEALSSSELVQRYRIYASEDPEYLLTVELM
jgi:hypothetical protein